jgi:hypothetical protein
MFIFIRQFLKFASLLAGLAQKIFWTQVKCSANRHAMAANL